jgi:hypothetical protein
MADIEFSVQLAEAFELVRFLASQPSFLASPHNHLVFARRAAFDMPRAEDIFCHTA